MTEQLNNKGSCDKPLNHFSVLASGCQGKAVNPKFEFYSESGCSLAEGSRLYSGIGSQSHFSRTQGTFKETSKKKKKKNGEAGWNVMPENCLLLGKKQRNKGNLSKKVMQIVKYLSGTSEKALLQVFGNMSCLWDDHLEEGVATLSSILAWRIPMDKRAFSPWGRRHS